MSAINELVAEALNEPVDIPRGLFRARNPENKVKPSDLAFKAVYGRFPVGELQGAENNHEEHLDDNIRNQLDQIPNISIRTICEGHNRDRVAHIIFIPDAQNEKQIQRIVENLKKCPGTYTAYDRGNQGRFRVCVAAKVWYQKDGNNDRWKEWWSQIPNCLMGNIK